MSPVSHRLRQIYTAKMCADLKDVEFAMGESRALAARYGYTPAIRRRLASLSRIIPKLANS